MDAMVMFELDAPQQGDYEKAYAILKRVRIEPVAKGDISMGRIAIAKLHKFSTVTALRAFVDLAFARAGLRVRRLFVGFLTEWENDGARSDSARCH